MGGQAAARAIGILLGLQCTLNPLMGNPVWQAEIAALPTAEQARAMAEPSVKERILAAAAAEGAGLLSGYERMFELGDTPDYEPDPSTSLAARAAREGREPLELTYDLLVQDEGRSFIYLPIINRFDGNLDAVGEMLGHEHTVPGLRSEEHTSELQSLMHNSYAVFCLKKKKHNLKKSNKIHNNTHPTTNTDKTSSTTPKYLHTQKTTKTQTDKT